MGSIGYTSDPLGICGAGFDHNIRNKQYIRRIQTHYQIQLYLLAVERFVWRDLPPSISPRVLEQSLILRGNVLFFRDPYMGVLALPSTNTGRFNIYDIPKTRYINTASGYHARRTEQNSVICFNDKSLLPFYPEVTYYAWQLANVQKAKTMNVAQQMRSKIIITNADNKASVERILGEADLGRPYVIADESLLMRGGSSTSVADIGGEYICDKLEEEKRAIFREYLTRLGYRSMSAEKAERVNIAETTGNDEHYMANRTGALSMRQLACEQVNRMFGTNITVEFNPDCLATEYLYAETMRRAESGASAAAKNTVCGAEVEEGE